MLRVLSSRVHQSVGAAAAGTATASVLATATTTTSASVVASYVGTTPVLLSRTLASLTTGCNGCRGSGSGSVSVSGSGSVRSGVVSIVHSSGLSCGCGSCGRDNWSLVSHSYSSSSSSSSRRRRSGVNGNTTVNLLTPHRRSLSTCVGAYVNTASEQSPPSTDSGVLAGSSSSSSSSSSGGGGGGGSGVREVEAAAIVRGRFRGMNVGKKPVVLPDGVTADISTDAVVVTGPLGSLSFPITPGLRVTEDAAPEGTAGRALYVHRDVITKHVKAMYGTTRSILAHSVEGVSKGHTAELELVGVGFRAATQAAPPNWKGPPRSLRGRVGKASGTPSDTVLVMKLGYSHDSHYAVPDDVSVEVPAPTSIVVKGINLMRVRQVAAEIRAYRRPDAYKGKGVRYKGEVVALKPGKKR